MSITPRILAIEPDRAHALALKKFVQSCIDADLVVVDSVPSAKAAIAEQLPQAVLVSELVSPDDDVELTAAPGSELPGEIGRVVRIVTTHYAQRGPTDSIVGTLSALKGASPSLAVAILRMG